MTESLPVVAFIGVGTMAEAMVDKAIEGGWPRERILMSHRREDRRRELSELYGITVSEDNVATAAKGDVIMVGVRPQELPAMLESLKPAFKAGQTLLSVAAGMTVDWLTPRVAQGMTVVRVTPPPTAWVGAGVTLLSTGVELPAGLKSAIERMVKSTCERMEWIDDALMEPITAMALGLTPYTSMIVKTLIETGIEQGIDPAFARRMVIDGLYATARMLRDPRFTPEHVIETVATREGLTWCSLHTMEAYGVFKGIRAGARAMTGRSYEFRGERVPDEYMGFLR